MLRDDVGVLFDGYACCIVSSTLLLR